VRYLDRTLVVTEKWDSLHADAIVLEGLLYPK
jgi:hypothetical protein